MRWLDSITDSTDMNLGKFQVSTFTTALVSRVSIVSRFVIDFIPRSKHLLISCLQSPSTVILESKKIKSVTLSIVSPSICHEVMGQDAMIIVF